MYLFSEKLTDFYEKKFAARRLCKNGSPVCILLANVHGTLLTESTGVKTSLFLA
jgi:hypothetical protein